jgi:hypothetical protein
VAAWLSHALSLCNLNWQGHPLAKQGKERDPLTSSSSCLTVGDIQESLRAESRCLWSQDPASCGVNLLK